MANRKAVENVLGKTQVFEEERTHPTHHTGYIHSVTVQGQQKTKSLATVPMGKNVFISASKLWSTSILYVKDHTVSAVRTNKNWTEQKRLFSCIYWWDGREESLIALTRTQSPLTHFPLSGQSE